jgi:hypothetical protein
MASIDNDIITELNLLTVDRFTRMIEDKVRRGMSYLEAVVFLSENLQLDTKETKSLISKTIVEKIREEAIELNYLKNKTKNHKLY